MTLIEFLGFVIVLIAMGLIMAKRAYDEYQRRKYPEKYAEEEQQKEEAMREFLRSLDIEMETEEEAEAVVYAEPPPPPPPKRSVGDEFSFERPLEERHPESAVEERIFSVALDERYAIPRQRIASPGMRIPEARDAYQIAGKPSHAGRLIKKDKLKTAIILREILGPPKHEQL